MYFIQAVNLFKPRTELLTRVHLPLPHPHSYWAASLFWLGINEEEDVSLPLVSLPLVSLSPSSSQALELIKVCNYTVLCLFTPPNTRIRQDISGVLSEMSCNEPGSWHLGIKCFVFAWIWQPMFCCFVLFLVWFYLWNDSFLFCFSVFPASSIQ